jgi:uncharacterized membrane protein
MPKTGCSPKNQYYLAGRPKAFRTSDGTAVPVNGYCGTALLTIMTLLFLFLLLVGPYLLLTLAGRLSSRLQIVPSKRARVGLSVFFIFTGVGHFVRTQGMAAMLPPSLPYRIELVYLTGILELLGAIGVWIPRLTRLTGLLLILMLIGILPANIYSANNRVDFGGHETGPVYLLVRIPFQLFVIWWTYFATEQNWFSSLRKVK